MPIQEKCRVLDHQKLTSCHYKLILASAYISSHAAPGKFVNVRCGESYDPLLRRPLSIHRISKEHQRFELLYEVVGRGTEILAKTSVGSELDIVGPLGNGFKLEEKNNIAILVAGGMGVAPLLALAEQITLHPSPLTKALYVLIGAKHREMVLCEKEFKELADQVIIATDDGSAGKKGFVSDILVDLLENTIGTRDGSTTLAASLGLGTIYACGPGPMLRAVSEIAYQKKIDCQLSMEQHMACGIGTCMGCVIKTNNGYKKVCDDGPVFSSNDLIW